MDLLKPIVLSLSIQPLKLAHRVEVELRFAAEVERAELEEQTNSLLIGELPTEYLECLPRFGWRNLRPRRSMLVQKRRQLLTLTRLHCGHSPLAPELSRTAKRFRLGRIVRCAARTEPIANRDVHLREKVGSCDGDTVFLKPAHAGLKSCPYLSRKIKLEVCSCYSPSSLRNLYVCRDMSPSLCKANAVDALRSVLR
ncbi:hypothetical protein ACFFGH_09155 [Lysobacter korlensis]|uniref:Uncharacterized protein n=1 Tax=Lysobacter korlensis TaxID=553636 RepID=A0ABV6RQ05_9GAMM